MASLEYYRSEGMRDRRAGYAKCDYPDKLNYEESSWWRAGWELEDEKQLARKLHPLRCETCKYGSKLTLNASNIVCTNKDHDPYPDVYVCSKQKGKWMPSARDGSSIAIVGCASHSDFQSGWYIKELFRKEIAKWKDEDPLFMAYVYGQEAGKKDERDEVLDKVTKRIDEMQPAVTTNAPVFNDGRDCAYNFVRRVIEELKHEVK